MTASLALLATPAFARSAKKEEKGKEGEAKVDPIITLQSMALPVIVDGRLVNYVFLHMSITLKTGVPVTVFEGREPMLRDAMVREAHNKPFTRSDSYVALDEARLKASVLRETSSLIGPGKIATVTVLKQIPRHFMAPPTKTTAQTGAKPPRPPEPRSDPNLVP
ncbi:hypothetical protein BH10PSE4_BH10PSE4_34960 [soil metagenome]